MAQLLEELTGDPDDLVDRLDHVDGDADGPGLVGNGAGDGLADPPSSVCRELIALGVVELLHSLDEAQVALLNEVQEQHTAAHIALGEGDDQTEVGLGQVLLGPLAGLDLLLQRTLGLFVDLDALGLHIFQGLLDLLAAHHGLGQSDLLLAGEQVDFTDLLEVHPHGVVDAEGVHQGVGIDDLLLRDFFDLLDGGHVPVGQVRQIIFPGSVDAHVFQDVVDAVHLLGFQIHLFQGVHQLVGGQTTLFAALVQHLAQLLCAGLAVDDLHDLLFAGLQLLLGDVD